MTIQSHYACEEPPNDTVICRFMQMDKFRDLFASEELYFRRTDLFKNDDPREGLPSDEYIRASRDLREGIVEDELKLISSQAFLRQISEASYLNCWQIFEGETIHMWGRYGKNNGVAVFSTFGRLKAAVSAFLDPVLIGKVKYTEEGRQRYNQIDFLFTKRQAFEKERELRVVVQCYDPLGGTNRHYDPNGIPHREPLDENPLHEWVHECKRRKIMLGDLVTEIRASPWSEPDTRDEIALWHKSKNLACPITKSELTSSLIPTPEELKSLGF